jgi:ferritin-like metal-binding protein YciE
VSITQNQPLNIDALRAVFVQQLTILYNAKNSLTNCLPELVKQATFKSLKAALMEDLEDSKRQMNSLKEIFRLMHESWLTDRCLGTNAVISEAFKQVSFNQNEHFQSDMSILVYMAAIENMQVGASKILNLMALKIAYHPYAQLVLECLDVSQDNADLFYYVAEEYFEN